MRKQTNRFSQHRNATSIHTVIREKTDLAKIYAEDGAFHSAARVLEDLATIVSRHAIATTPTDLMATGQLPVAVSRELLVRLEFELTHSIRTGDNDHKALPELRALLGKAGGQSDGFNPHGSGPVPIEAREG